MRYILISLFLLASTILVFAQGHCTDAAVNVFKAKDGACQRVAGTMQPLEENEH